jgi:hypothetical protein
VNLDQAASPNAVLRAFADQKVKLPLHMSDQDIGVILDDDGVDVITIDTNGTRPDDQVTIIASLVVAAINQFSETQEHQHGQ